MRSGSFPLVATLFATLALVLFAPAHAHAQAPAPTTYQVPMRDGTTLATDVYLPAGPAGTRFPVVLRRTPYGRTTSADIAHNFANAGYAFVSQDVRGRGQSQGRFLPFFDDGRDGPDTMNWITAQPFSNGRIGTYGGSAEGLVQLMALPDAPDALRCAYVLVAEDDLYEAMLPGGAWRTDLTTNWLEGLGEPAALTELRAHEVLDSYWDPARVDPTERGRVRASVFLLGGFYDIFAPGVPRTHRALQTQASMAARPNQFLVVGPWTHGGLNGTSQGEVTYDATAQYAAFGPDLVGFFGWCLRDGPRPTFPAVRYHVSHFADSGVAGSGEWRSADAWPPASTATTLYLHEDHTLDTNPPAAGGVSALLAVDPQSPVPSNGGGNLTTPAGPRDQTQVDARPDVLVAQTGVVERAVEVIGDVHATVWAASGSDDVDVVVRVSDVTPSGKVMLVTDGIRRGRFVTGYDAIRPLTRGAPTLFEVPIGPISLSLPPGHALRVSISGTSSPRYEPNPDVAMPLSSMPAPRTTTLTIYRDATHPSAIVLPLASGAFPAPTMVPADAGADASSAPDVASDTTPAPDGGTVPARGCSCATVPARTRVPRDFALTALALSAIVARSRRRSRAH